MFEPTALHIAARRADFPMVGLLVLYGANIRATAADERYTPRDMLLKEEREFVKKFDLSVAIALDAIQKNKITIALTLESASKAAQLPPLPNTLSLLVADCVGICDETFTHLSLILNNGKSRAQVDAAPHENEEDCGEQDSASDSSSNMPDSLPVGNGIKASSSSAEQPSNQQQATESEASTEQSISYKEVLDVEESAEASLSRFFPWIKDLTEELQQQILSSSIMRPLLELLESITQPNKLIADQLSTKEIEESFSIEYQAHYGQDSLYNTTMQAEAQVSQYDSLIDLSEGAGTIPSDGILIDHLPKHDINFGAPCSLDGLASF